MVSVDDFFLTTDEMTIPAISPPDGATCEQFSLASSSNSPANFGAYGTYSRTAAVVFDWPVYQNENGWLAEMNKLGFWWISKDGDEIFIWGTQKGQNCPAALSGEAWWSTIGGRFSVVFQLTVLISSQEI
ncbi:unnamed protein product [Oikopleura dioica]|uniref:Uncharacterized protein n=1 Tax=Oikopleura dioica TaxID=34765 RepID=E4Y1X2_OIKDI|nr:unnamed protein product [Oikopleura dioica]